MSGVEKADTGLAFGEAVYDGSGNQLGTIRGFDEHGFCVTTEEGIGALSSEHLVAGAPGEAELTRRCWECGEMGDIERVPERCPACGAARESIYHWIED